jgi:hypothetical protein
MDWYILERDGEFKVVGVLEGNDPLYGEGSWYTDGIPHKSREEAEFLAELTAKQARDWARRTEGLTEAQIASIMEDDDNS